MPSRFFSIAWRLGLRTNINTYNITICHKYQKSELFIRHNVSILYWFACPATHIRLGDLVNYCCFVDFLISCFYRLDYYNAFLFLSLLIWQFKTVKMPKKDAGKPKGKASSYTCFVQTCRDEHKKKNPSEPLVLSEFSKKCGEKWKVCCVDIYLL